MSHITPNLGLTVWDSPSDAFNSTELADNFDAIDADATRVRPTNSAEVLATLPGVGNFNGRLVYLSAADGGFAAGTLVRFQGSTWGAVGPIEALAAVPTSGNYPGRVVLLTAISGTFAAWSLITYNGTSWAPVNQTYELLASVPVTNNFAGRLVLLTASSGGFESYSLIVYDGSAYHRVDKRGIEVGATLPGSPYAGQVFIPNVDVSGFLAYDVVRWNGSAWQQVSHPPLISAATLAGLGSVPNGYEVYLQADATNGVNWHLRYNSGSSSAQKWESIGGGPPIIATIDAPQTNSLTTYSDLGTVGPSIIIPRTGDYDVTQYAIYSGNDQGFISLSGAGITVGDAEAATSGNLGFLGSAHYEVLQRRKRYSLTGGGTLKMMYRGISANPRTWSYRQLSITPVRL
jgi:hypothetical protein